MNPLGPLGYFEIFSKMILQKFRQTNLIKMRPLLSQCVSYPQIRVIALYLKSMISKREGKREADIPESDNTDLLKSNLAVPPKIRKRNNIPNFFLLISENNNSDFVPCPSFFFYFCHDFGKNFGIRFYAKNKKRR